MKRQNRFTFIELLIVIAIIGITASIFHGAIGEYKAEHARDSAPTIEFTATK